MGRKPGKVREWWRRLRESSRFHDVLVFLIFVVVAAGFWIVIALNDSVTQNFKVKVGLVNVPDTVTFVTDPPAEFTVTVRDKGTNILRSGLTRQPVVEFNFRDYADEGIFRLTKSEINAAIKKTFGSSVQISSMSLDSLRLYYTDSRGKRVPVRVNVDATAASGYVISGQPRALQTGVRIYSYGDETDTVRYVQTVSLTRRNLSKTAQFEVKLQPIKGVKIVPSTIKIEIPVEPLVRKDGYAQVEARNVPEGRSLLLFPNKVQVSYYVPMSKFNDDDEPVTATVDFDDIQRVAGSRLPVSIARMPEYVVNPELQTDSIEYTIMLH